MTTSIQSQIVDYVVGTSCLTYSTGKPSGLAVGRGTTVPAVNVTEPRIDVYIGPERTQGVGRVGMNEGPTMRFVTLYLECRTAGGVSPDLALDPIKVWAEQRIYAAETAHFGSLYGEITGWSSHQDARQLDQQYAMATLEVEVRYVTARGDPTTRP